jgi:hypothetical protein
MPQRHCPGGEQPAGCGFAAERAIGGFSDRPIAAKYSEGIVGIAAGDRNLKKITGFHARGDDTTHKGHHVDPDPQHLAHPSTGRWACGLRSGPWPEQVARPELYPAAA